jgi:hypothetical protein
MQKANKICATQASAAAPSASRSLSGISQGIS